MNNDYATFIEEDTLTLERILPGPIEQVWECLTEDEHKKKWLSGGNVEPHVGGKVTHHFDNQAFSDEYEPTPKKYSDMPDKVTMSGKVLAWEPYSMLSYSWEEGDGSSSEVIFKLSEMDDQQVKLVLIHTKVPDSKDFKVGVSAGWHTHLNILRNILEGKKPGGFWSVHMPLESEYEKKLYG